MNDGDCMEWNVYIRDFNAKEIKIVNVFDYSSFSKDVSKLLKKKLDREEFSKELKRAVMYLFWSRAEYEVILTSWPPYIDKKELDRLNAEYEEYNAKWGHYPYCTDVRLTTAMKIDVYDQIALNWERFVDYVIGFRK